MNMCANIFFFFFKQNLNKVYFVNKPLFQYCKYKYIVKKKNKKKNMHAHPKYMIQISY